MVKSSFMSQAFMSQVFAYEPAKLKPRCNRGVKFTYILMGLLLFFVVGLAHAQVIAKDDSFGVPSNVLSSEPFIVEALGVLENDTLDGETDQGLTAVLVTGVTNGTLTCPSPGVGTRLCTDGSFEYSPEAGFSGIDSFTYRAFSGAMPSTTTATVTLTACTQEKDQDGNNLELFSCWKESSYRTKLAELRYKTFEEGFEEAAWDSVRSMVDDPNTSPEIVSQGIAWTTNHPATNDITTGSGAARTGLWGVYDPQHGVATGSEETCNIDNPPESCLFYDGLSGSIQPGGNPAYSLLRGVGGYLDSNTGGGTIDIILYGGTHTAGGGTTINAGKLPHVTYRFFGVIDATASGFSGFEFREVNGKIGQARLVSGDDFTIAADVDPNIIFGDGFESQ